MFKQEDEGVHLRSFGSLIRKDIVLVSRQITKIYADIDQFEQKQKRHQPLSDAVVSQFNLDMRELLKNLEHVKVYVQQEEKKQSHEFEHFLDNLIKTHILNKLGSGKKKIKKLFDDTLSHIYDDFRKEFRNERMLARGRRPRVGLLKRVMGNHSLDGQIRSDARKEIKVSHEVSELMDTLLHTSKAIVAGAKPFDTHFEKDVTHLCTVVKKEFDLLLDELLDAEVQENDVLKRLRKLKFQNEKHNMLLHDTADKIHVKLKHDVKAARREEREIKHFEQHFSHAA